MAKRKFDVAILADEVTLDIRGPIVGNVETTYHQDAINSVLDQYVTDNGVTKKVKILRTVKGRHRDETVDGDYLVGANPFNLSDILDEVHHKVAAPCPPHCDLGR